MAIPLTKSLPEWCKSKGIDWKKLTDKPNWEKEPIMQEYYDETNPFKQPPKV